MKKVIIIFGMLAVLSFALFSMNQDKIVLNLMSKAVEKNFSSNLLDNLPDGLHVVLCGAGSPLPDPKRSGPCTAVIAGKQIYIVDSGAGSSENLTMFKVPQGEISGVLLTHFHSDHIDGLGELLMQRWVNASNTMPLPVYGPTGVEKVVEGYNTAYAQDQLYRIAHHGADTIIPSGAGGQAQPFQTPKSGTLLPIVEKDGLSISALLVDHSPINPAVGYRFDYKGRSVVVSGDTSKSSNLQALSNNIDLLVHEALNHTMVKNITQAAQKAGRPRMVKITTDILDYHTSPVEAAEIARDANVGHLLFTHIVPSLPFSPMEKLFAKGVDDIYAGEFTVGQDGTMVNLEANKKTIKVSKAGTFM